MKEYRIDTFHVKKHEKKYFDTESEARIFGEKENKKGKIVFLLKHLIDDKYDVLEEIK